MINEEASKRSALSRIVNWGTVWGLIFLTIGYNVVSAYQKKDVNKQVLQAQLQQRARELDSLKTVKYQLDNQLNQIRSALDQCETAQTSAITDRRQTVATRGL
ncbi:hypothetical protein BN8_05429 [Fibrisoma limi BUZ 3]|uniref:Uncharacterized protein n=1 Tax=Fibrisoma limi BUZ 3 TaxID=1185876 RepID=I2GQD7_9BACT|nr:hypothetical protein [Fibrisoma limi]CCH56115.1 hypothetical protein BN8_05429 [Fibrisoma limi BUZ 3]